MNRILDLQRMRVTNSGPIALAKSGGSCNNYSCSFECNG